MKKLLLPVALIILSCSKDEVCDTTPKFSTLTTKDISYDLVTVIGQITQAECDNNLVSKGIVYSTKELPTVEDSKLAISESSFSKELDNLLPSTVYYVRPYLTNSDGDFYGSQISFTTIGDDIQFSDVVTTSSISKISVSASFSFQQGNGIVTTSKGVEFNGEKVIDESTENSISVELKNLEPNSEHTFKLFVTNKFGTTLSEAIVISTEDYGAVFGSISIEKINPTTVSINTSYEVDYSGDEITTKKGFALSETEDFSNETIFESNLDLSNIVVDEASGLTHNNTYYCKAFVENEYGVAYSDVITFSTIDATVEITEPQVSELSWCCATVTSNVSEASEYVNEWGYQLSKDENWSNNSFQTFKSSEVFSPSSSNTPNLVFSYDFIDLDNPVKYYVRAYVKNDYETYYSSTITFNTPERLDSDNDGIYDDQDNCVNTPNPDQNDFDGDGVGDACDDTDGDGVMDAIDNCKETANKNQDDNDSDGIGDVCDPDDDNDGVNDDEDNCSNTHNPEQEDYDSDGIGDVCDDSDSDGIKDDKDNCVDTANAEQKDTDGDGIGDVCDDSDGDGITDDIDNCINTSNPNQEDIDNDGVGDVCDDSDNDGLLDSVDNCVFVYNLDQSDDDGDGIGNYCDDDYLIDATELTDSQRGWYPNYPFVRVTNHNTLKDGHYFVKDKAISFDGEIYKINTNPGNPIWDLRFFKYYTSLTKIYTATMGEFVNFTMPDASESLTEIDMQFHNVNKEVANVTLSGHSNLKRVRIGSIWSIESVTIDNLPSLEYLDLSISNSEDYVDVDLTNNVGVEVNGIRRIGTLKITGNLSTLNISNMEIGSLTAHPKNQEELEFNTYFDDQINLSGGMIDIRYSEVKKLKINGIDWLINLKINENLECISSDNNSLFYDVIQNGSIKSYRNENYYRLIRKVQMYWGEYDLYHDWFITAETLNLLSESCF